MKKTKKIEYNNDEFHIDYDASGIEAGRRVYLWIFRLGFLFLVFFTISLILYINQHHNRAITFEDISYVLSALSVPFVIFTVGFLAKQTQEAIENNIKKEMPIIIVKPKLSWLNPKYNKYNKIITEKLVLNCDTRNVSNYPAILVKIVVDKIVLSDEKKLEQKSIIKHPISYAIDGLIPGRDGVNHNEEDDISVELTGKCIGLFESILINSDRFKLTTIITVSFKSLRNLNFITRAKIVWSGKSCRNILNHRQKKLLDECTDEYKRNSRLILSNLLGANINNFFSGLVSIIK